LNIPIYNYLGNLINELERFIKDLGIFIDESRIFNNDSKIIRIVLKYSNMNYEFPEIFMNIRK
jgi:hypothetical protein